MNWVITPFKRSSPQLQLFCFAHAGGGASTFFSWGKIAPEWLEISAIQLPGHESRMSEPLSTDWSQLVKSISLSITKSIKVPYAFFGHSMGALLAYETARNLRCMSNYEPCALFLSGRNAPTASSRLPSISQTENEIFLAELSKRYHGIPDEIFQEPEIREIYLPILRNDIKLVETYQYTTLPPLTCPFFIYYGADDSLITLGEISGWSELTSNTLYQHKFPGSHLYHITHRNELLKKLFEDLLILSKSNRKLI